MIVIEASAMVDAIVGEPANAELLAVIADSELHAPSLLDYEVAGALRGHALADRIAEQRLADQDPSLVLLRCPRIGLRVLRRDLRPRRHRELASHAPPSRALLREAPSVFRGHFS